MARCARCAEASGTPCGLAGLCNPGEFAIAACDVCGSVLVDQDGRRMAAAVDLGRSAEKAGLRKVIHDKVRGAAERLREVRS